ncbi:MAG: hypothetical protein P1P69_01580 [Methanosarcinaceae archaeon]|nr:hypothetical protein [Methanosarcinaceae archaeon]MDF1533178.1 hypothetical protein [Methanosarcinaceae archaeon]
MTELKDIDDDILEHQRKKRTMDDIIGLVKMEGNAVESKKAIQKGIR